MTMVTAPTLLVRLPNPTTAMAAGIAYASQPDAFESVSNYGGGTVADIAEAIKFAADNDADVLKHDGGSGESQLMKDAINYAHQKAW